jgi:hypothetical protein
MTLIQLGTMWGWGTRLFNSTLVSSECLSCGNEERQLVVSRQEYDFDCFDSNSTSSWHQRPDVPWALIVDRCWSWTTEDILNVEEQPERYSALTEDFDFEWHSQRWEMVPATPYRELVTLSNGSTNGYPRGEGVVSTGPTYTDVLIIPTHAPTWVAEKVDTMSFI